MANDSSTLLTLLILNNQNENMSEHNQLITILGSWIRNKPAEEIITNSVDLGYIVKDDLNRYSPTEMGENYWTQNTSTIQSTLNEAFPFAQNELSLLWNGVKSYETVTSPISVAYMYPSIMDRVKAIFVDSLLIVAMMTIATTILEKYSIDSDIVTIGICIFIFLLYEPLSVSMFGGSVGHYAIGLRVKNKNNPTKNVNFILAIVRYIVKALLGWLSLITITLNNNGQAIHDLAANAIVIYKKK